MGTARRPLAILNQSDRLSAFFLSNKETVYCLHFCANVESHTTHLTQTNQKSLITHRTRTHVQPQPYMSWKQEYTHWTISNVSNQPPLVYKHAKRWTLKSVRLLHVSICAYLVHTPLFYQLRDGKLKKLTPATCKLWDSPLSPTHCCCKRCFCCCGVGTWWHRRVIVYWICRFVICDFEDWMFRSTRFSVHYFSDNLVCWHLLYRKHDAFPNHLRWALVT